MVRIAGFHPADPGSIPGDEEMMSWEDIKSTTQDIGGVPLAIIANADELRYACFILIHHQLN